MTRRLSVVVGKYDFSAAVDLPEHVVLTVRELTFNIAGGPETCTIDVASDEPEQLIMWLNRLRYPVDIYDESGNWLWGGFIHQAEATVGSINRRVSLDRYCNAVQVQYGTELTDWATDLGGITLRGRWEQRESAGNVDAASAVIWRDRLLANYSKLRMAVSSDRGGSENGATLTCRGWYAMLDARYFAAGSLQYYFNNTFNTFHTPEKGDGDITQQYDLEIWDNHWYDEGSQTTVEVGGILAYYDVVMSRSSQILSVELHIDGVMSSFPCTVTMYPDPGPIYGATKIAESTLYPQGWSWNAWIMSPHATIPNGRYWFTFTSPAGWSNRWQLRASRTDPAPIWGAYNGGWNILGRRLEQAGIYQVFVDAHPGRPLLRVNGGIDNVERIRDAVTAYGQVITGVDTVGGVTSGLLNNTYVAQGPRLLAAIEEIAGQGIYPGYQRLLMTVTRDRRLAIRQEPAGDATNAPIILGADGALRNRYGEPWGLTDPCGQWCTLEGDVPATLTAMVRNPEVSSFLVEQATYSVDEDRWSVASGDGVQPYNQFGIMTK